MIMRRLSRPLLLALLLLTLLLGLSDRGDAFSQTPSFTLEGNALVLPSLVSFEAGAAKLTPEGEATLAFIKSYLDAKPYVTLLRIEVHTDSTGSENFNQLLSEDRALAATLWLVAQGVDCARLLPVGFGSTKPIADNSTAEGRAKNRRVEAVNAALRGRLIGGLPADGGGRIAGDPCAR